MAKEGDWRNRPLEREREGDWPGNSNVEEGLGLIEAVPVSNLRMSLRRLRRGLKRLWFSGITF